MHNRVQRHSQRSQRAIRSDAVGVRVKQSRPKMWPYMSQDETAFIQQPSLETWLWGARCPIFRSGSLRHIQRRGCTHNGVQDRPHLPKERKGSSIQTQLVHMWATIMSGCGRGAKGGCCGFPLYFIIYAPYQTPALESHC